MAGPPAVRGSIAADEIVLPIVDMYLDDGKLWFVAHVKGPVLDVHAADYVVYDRSGGVFIRAIGIGGLSWSRVHAGDTLTLITPVRFTEQLAFGK